MKINMFGMIVVCSPSYHSLIFLLFSKQLYHSTPQGQGEEEEEEEEEEVGYIHDVTLHKI